MHGGPPARAIGGTAASAAGRGVIDVGHLYFLLGLGALLLLALILNLHRRFGRRARWPYVADEVLFSPPQRAFMAALERALGPDYRVFGRVRVADVIGLRPRLDPAAARRAYARLAGRSFDFLVCTAATGAIACAVNLVPRSRRGRLPAPDLLDRICAAAGLPYVCLREADDYAPTELARRVHAAIAVRRPPPPPVAAEVRHHVSEVSVDDAREPRLRPVRTRPVAGNPDPDPAPLPRPPAAPVLAPTIGGVPRIEPTLLTDGELEPGPQFHIAAGLDHDDERPARGGRA